jgi:hypothetical protein
MECRRTEGLLVILFKFKVNDGLELCGRFSFDLTIIPVNLNILIVGHVLLARR